MEGDKTAEISDTADQHRTPARSNTTHYRSVWEATRCAALFYGLTKNQLKQFSFQMRVDMLKKVEEATKAKDVSFLPGRNFPKITSDDYEEIKKNAWTKLELKSAAEAAAKNDASIWQPAIDMKEEAWKSAGELKK